MVFLVVCCLDDLCWRVLGLIIADSVGVLLLLVTLLFLVVAIYCVWGLVIAVVLLMVCVGVEFVNSVGIAFVFRFYVAVCWLVCLCLMLLFVCDLFCGC